MHSYVEKEQETLVLYCPPHFEVLLSDNKRQKEAFDIIAGALFPAKSYKMCFDTIATQFSPFALQQQLMHQEHQQEQKRLRQSFIAQVLEKVAECEEVPPLEQS